MGEMDPVDVLHKYWGFSGFRGPQAEVVAAVVEGHDVMVVMATGGGKSLCMQIPALVLGRPGFVISPLISLMQDQVGALTARGVRACFLGSAQNDETVKAGAWAGLYQLVYLTPELAAASYDRLAALHSRVGVSLLAVDEAHCITEWGHDYRPEYMRIGELRDALPGVPIVAVTATATPTVRLEIARLLRLREGATRTFITSFERPNLRFEVQRRPAARALVAAIASAFVRMCMPSGGSAIVYTLTTRDADAMARELARYHSLAGMRISSYHAKLGPDRRTEVHDAFIGGRIRMVVATVAYGMGIDKPDVRIVMHVGAPSSLEAYFQQAGRAGRDGQPALCRLYWSPADVATADLVRGACPDAARARVTGAGITAIQGYCMTTSCRAAKLVHHFGDPNTPIQSLPCSGGCDCCDRMINAPDATDVTVEGRLLLDAVINLGCRYGLGRAIDIVTGGVVDARHVVGSGTKHSTDWWRGLAGLLMSIGALEYRTVSICGGRKSLSAIALGPSARSLPDPLLLQLTPDMHAMTESCGNKFRAAVGGFALSIHKQPPRRVSLITIPASVTVSQLAASASARIVNKPGAVLLSYASKYAEGISIDDIAADAGVPRAKIISYLVRCSTVTDTVNRRFRDEEIAPGPLGHSSVIVAVVRGLNRLGDDTKLHPSLACAFSRSIEELSADDKLVTYVPLLQYWHVLAVAAACF